MLGHAAGIRRERCCERRIHDSGMTIRHTLEAFDWHFQPSLDRSVVEELAGLGFLARKQDLVITGKPGTGKSHILGAIALRACIGALASRSSTTCLHRRLSLRLSVSTSVTSCSRFSQSHSKGTGVLGPAAKQVPLHLQGRSGRQTSNSSWTFRAGPSL